MILAEKTRRFLRGTLIYLAVFTAVVSANHGYALHQYYIVAKHWPRVAATIVDQTYARCGRLIFGCERYHLRYEYGGVEQHTIVVTWKNLQQTDLLLKVDPTDPRTSLLDPALDLGMQLRWLGATGVALIIAFFAQRIISQQRSHSPVTDKQNS